MILLTGRELEEEKKKSIHDDSVIFEVKLLEVFPREDILKITRPSLRKKNYSVIAHLQRIYSK